MIPQVIAIRERGNGLVHHQAEIEVGARSTHQAYAHPLLALRVGIIIGLWKRNEILPDPHVPIRAAFTQILVQAHLAIAC